jgi:hypothetical protein
MTRCIKYYQVHPIYLNKITDKTPVSEIFVSLEDFRTAVALIRKHLNGYKGIDLIEETEAFMGSL